MVVGLAVLAGVMIIPRLSINLSSLNALQNVLPLTNNANRRLLDSATPAAVATAAPTATPRPGLVERFAGSGVSVSVAEPPQNTAETVLIRLRRDNQPASNSTSGQLSHIARSRSAGRPPAASRPTEAGPPRSLSQAASPMRLAHRRSIWRAR